MQGREIRAAGELVAGAFGGTARYIQQMHEGIAGRPFRALGLMGEPVRAIHDRVAAGGSRGVARALRAGPRAAASLFAGAAPADAPALADSPRGSIALG